MIKVERARALRSYALYRVRNTQATTDGLIYLTLYNQIDLSTKSFKSMFTSPKTETWFSKYVFSKKKNQFIL